MKKLWFLLALLGMLTPGVSDAATATAKVTLSTTAWTDLTAVVGGTAGPLLVSSQGMVVYAVSDGTPSIPANQGFPLPADTAVTINTASHVWAMSASTVVAYAYVAPILAGGSGGSGGGSVTQGTSPWVMDTTGSGVLDGEIKGPIAVQASHGVNIGGVEGGTASGVAPTEYPLYEGGRGATTFPTAVADTQKVGRMSDKYGRTVTIPDAPPDLWFTATATTSTNTTLVAADVSNKIALVGIECDTQAAAASAGLVVLTDAASNTMARLGLPNAGNGSAHVQSLRQPKRTSAINSAVTMTVTGGQSTTCTVDYYKVPT